MIEAQSYLIAIQAQYVFDGKMGGVETQLFALLYELGKLEGPERYLVLCEPSSLAKIRPVLGPNMQVVLHSQGVLRRLMKRMPPPGKQAWRQIQRTLLSRKGNTAQAGGLPWWQTGPNRELECSDAKLVHAFIPEFLSTQKKVILNIHDLQHEHFPEFFPSEILARRRFVYLNASRRAAAVVAGSRYTRMDVVKNYPDVADKIWTIPLAAAMGRYELPTEAETQSVLQKYGLNESYMLYPAVTWEHKNHVRLLEAVTRLNREGLKTSLVCTGALLEPAWTKIQAAIKGNHLDSQVHMLGYVSTHDLVALYSACRFVIAPSLFEQLSGPLAEAWQIKVPAAVSNVTSVPEQSGDAAVLFDPYSVEDIASAIQSLWTNDEIRKVLVSRGVERMKVFSWEKIAKSYRALYRSIAQWPLTEEDKDLLNTASHN